MSAMASQISGVSLFRQKAKTTSKHRVTGHCEGNPSVSGGFPSQRVSNAEKVYLWWRHHDLGIVFYNIIHVYENQFIPHNKRDHEWLITYSIATNITASLIKGTSVIHTQRLRQMTWRNHYKINYGASLGNTLYNNSERRHMSAVVSQITNNSLVCSAAFSN